MKTVNPILRSLVVKTQTQMNMTCHFISFAKIFLSIYYLYKDAVIIFENLYIGLRDNSRWTECCEADSNFKTFLTKTFSIVCISLNKLRIEFKLHNY